MNWVGWILAYWSVVHSVVELILAGAILYFAWASWRISSRLARLIGAVETHASMSIKLEAKKQGVPIVWWDPTVETLPDEEAAHGEECRLEKISAPLAEHLRKYTGRTARKRESELRRMAREKVRGQSLRS